MPVIEKTERLIMNNSQKSIGFKGVRTAIIVSAILLVSLLFRVPSFYLPHNHGDQIQYLALAMKLDNSGFSGYNLRDVSLLLSVDKTSFAFAPREKYPKHIDFTKTLPEYYDEPLFHKPPLFIYALVLSHKLFVQGKIYEGLGGSSLGYKVFKTRPKKFLEIQFYSMIVPILFSLLLIMATFFLGKILFSEKIATYAALLLSFSPIELLSANRIWTDDMLAFFVTTSVILFLIARKKERSWISCIAGISAGMAVLTKQTGGLIFGTIIIYSFWINRDFLKDVKKWYFLILDKYLATFALGFFLSTAPWFIAVYKTYGHPLYLPEQIMREGLRLWPEVLKTRPHPLVFFSVGIPCMSPAFICAYASLKNVFLSIKAPFRKTRNTDDAIIILWLWITAFMYFFIFRGGGAEHRRMLPAYPAIALLSAYILDKLKIFIASRSKDQLIAEFSVAAIIFFSILWSGYIGVTSVFKGQALITVPF